MSAIHILPNARFVCLTAVSLKKPRKLGSQSDCRRKYVDALHFPRPSLWSADVGQEPRNNSCGDFYPGARNWREYRYVQSLQYFSAQTCFISRSTATGNGFESRAGSAGTRL